MDVLGPVLQPMLQLLRQFASKPTFWLLALALLLIAIGRLPVVKGWFGEFTVNLQAKLFLSKRDYAMVPNVTIPDGMGGTTQIDHLVVSRFGVFVVETKNMKGWIFGGEHDGEWTQKIHARHSQKFQNPLRQNYKHTKTLAEALALPPEKVFSVIAFVGDCTLKTRDVLPSNVRTNAGWVRFVKEHRTPLFTEDEVAALLERIEESRLAPGFHTNREHVRYVKGLKDAGRQSRETVVAQVNVTRPVAESAVREATIAPLPPVPNQLAAGSTCPRCGGTLVTRTARQGANAGKTFLGCSGFPKCRFVG